MTYPIVPHPTVITGAGRTTRVSYAHTGSSAYAKLAGGVKTFVTRTIPNFARRVGAGLYKVARFLYNVTKTAVNQAVKFTWRLITNVSQRAVRASKAAYSVGKKTSSKIPGATRAAAKGVGKVVGGSIRRVADFNAGLSEGIAGDSANYIPRKYRQDPKKFDALSEPKRAKITRRAEGRRNAVVGVTRRALLAAEVSGGLKLVSKSIENFDPLSNLDLHGIRLSKQSAKKGRE